MKVFNASVDGATVLGVTLPPGIIVGLGLQMVCSSAAGAADTNVWAGFASSPDSNNSIMRMTLTVEAGQSLSESMFVPMRIPVPVPTQMFIRSNHADAGGIIQVFME
jgi:hypothetical protein